MKKLILSLVAALCLGGFSTTQAQVKFGVVGGLNVSKLSYERSKLFDSENRAGWFIGPKMWVKVPLVGLGVRLVNHLEIGATYNIALSNIGDIHIPVISDVTKNAKSDFKSNSWQVSAAYLF